MIDLDECIAWSWHGVGTAQGFREKWLTPAGLEFIVIFLAIHIAHYRTTVE
jgi:hypothetical protein